MLVTDLLQTAFRKGHNSSESLSCSLCEAVRHFHISQPVNVVAFCSEEHAHGDEANLHMLDIRRAPGY